MSTILRISRRIVSRAFILISLVAMALNLESCSDSMATTPLPGTSDVLNRIVVTPSAITMAVGDTMTLSVVTLNIVGDTIAVDESTPVIWTAFNPEIVSVDSNGMLEAHQPTENFVSVSATWEHGGVTKIDTVYMNVTALRYPVTSFRFIPRDSARTARYPMFVDLSYLQIDALDANQDSVMTPQVMFEAHDMNGTPIPVGTGFGIYTFYIGGRYAVYTTGARIAIGKFWFIAYSTVYGRPIRDSLLMTGLYAPDLNIEIGADTVLDVMFSPQKNATSYGQRCVFAEFQNNSDIPIDIIFDDSSKARSCVPGDTRTGNIQRILPFQPQSRQFPDIGVRTWSVRNSNTGAMVPGLTGKIEIREP